MACKRGYACIPSNLRIPMNDHPTLLPLDVARRASTGQASDQSLTLGPDKATQQMIRLKLWREVCIRANYLLAYTDMFMIIGGQTGY